MERQFVSISEQSAEGKNFVFRFVKDERSDFISLKWQRKSINNDEEKFSVIQKRKNNEKWFVLESLTFYFDVVD